MIPRSRFSPPSTRAAVRSRIILAVSLIGSLTVGACGGEESIGPGAPVASVEVTPSAAVLVSLGETVQLTAGARDSSGRAIPGATFHWASSDDGIATVSETGLVTAVANGLVTITATSAGVEGTAAIGIAQEAVQLAFTLQPTTTLVGVSIAPVVEVSIQDALGSLVASATGEVTVALGENPGGGMLVGTTTQSTIDGVASFSDLLVDRGGTGYTLVASSASATTATSASFDVTALVFSSASAGWYYTCGLTTTGAAYCWGDGGLLGDGAQIGSPTPVPVSGGRTFASVDAGGIHTCGVTPDGTAYCWGGNGHGRLGDGTRTSRTAPVAVAGGFAFASVGAGNGHTCGVTTSGTAYCWGYNDDGRVGGVTAEDSCNILDISGNHIIGIIPCTLTPVPVSGALSFASISAATQTCGVTTSGTAYCWGANQVGQLGTMVQLDQCTVVTACASHYCDRENRSCSVTPVAVSRGLTFASVSGGDRYACGVTRTGTAYCWGSNRWGQLGDGSLGPEDCGLFEGPCSRTPVQVAGGFTFASVSAGDYHACGVTTTGTAYCWGYGGNGRLGDGTTTDRTTPVAVSGGLMFASVSAGAYHTCGVTTGGTAHCWGYNRWGQLGDGTKTDRLTPVRVVGQP